MSLKYLLPALQEQFRAYQTLPKLQSDSNDVDNASKPKIDEERQSSEAVNGTETAGHRGVGGDDEAQQIEAVNGTVESNTSTVARDAPNLNGVDIGDHRKDSNREQESDLVNADGGEVGGAAHIASEGDETAPTSDATDPNGSLKDSANHDASGAQSVPNGSPPTEEISAASHTAKDEQEVKGFAVLKNEDDLQNLLAEAFVLGRSTKKAEDEWFESLDKLILELKAHPAGAEPFLRPVSKKLAPDYDTVIRKPMDLGTVAKKIKSREYKEKKTFARDLNLIWSNCLLYNAVEGHPMRALAKYMKRLTDHHLEYILDRPDVPPFPNQAVVGTNSNEVFPATITNGESREIKSTLVDGVLQAAASLNPNGWRPIPNDVGESPAIIKSQQSMDIWRDMLEGPSRPAPNYPVPHPPLPISLPGGHLPVDPLPPWYPSPAQPPPQVRPSRRKPKAKNLSMSGKLLDKGKQRADEEALEDDRWWRQVLRSDSFAPSVPRARWSQLPNTTNPADRSEVPEYPAKSAKKRRRRRSVFLQDRIGHNITALHRIKEAAAKLQARASNPSSGTDETPAKLEWDNPSETWQLSVAEQLRAGGNIENPAEIDCVEALETVVTGLLAHVGFEGASHLSIQTIVAVALRRLQSLGKTFRMYLDTGSSKMTPGEVVRASLNENGSSVESLRSHIEDDIVKYGTKLDEVLRRFKQAFEEWTYQSAEVAGQEEDVSEGDMMFGTLPGMNIDMAEFLGMSNPLASLPRQLLKDRPSGEHQPPSSVAPNGDSAASQSISSSKKKASAVQLEYPLPPPLLPLRAQDVPLQIGLLRSFYNEKMGEEPFIVDDDFDASLPPLGAFGQVAGATGPGSGNVTSGGTGGGAKRKADAANNPAPGQGSGSGKASSGVKKAKGNKNAARGGVMKALDALQNEQDAVSTGIEVS